MRELGADEERGRAVGTRRDARAAADALGGIQRTLGSLALDWERIGIGRAPRAHRDVSPGLHDAIERAPIHDEIAHYRKHPRTKWFQDDRGPVAERTQRKQAGRRAGERPVRTPVHDDAARPADPLTTVAVERHGWLALRDQPLVQTIERFEERHLRTEVIELVAHERSRRVRIALTPDAERELHR